MQKLCIIILALLLCYEVGQTTAGVDIMCPLEPEIEAAIGAAPILGGLSKKMTAGDAIQNMVDKLKDEVEAETGKNYSKFKVKFYKVQGVTGTMFYVKVKVARHNYIHVKYLKKMWVRGCKLTYEGVEEGHKRKSEIKAFD